MKDTSVELAPAKNSNPPESSQSQRKVSQPSHPNTYVVVDSQKCT
jgi:hypothetical protein